MKCLMILITLLFAACSSDKYSSAPKPHGKWVPANIETEEPAR